MKKTVKIAAMLCLVAILLTSVGMFSGCGKKKEKVLIYTSVEDYVVADLNERLKEQFPDYDIIIEYLSTGTHGAKLLAEGTSTDCDITFNLEYGYLEQIDEAGYLADMSQYDKSIYVEDTVADGNYLIQIRNGGAIILNTEVMEAKGLAEPESYEDLLKPEYKGLISVPNPKASSTGYMFLKSLVNAWGEEEAFDYFDELTENVLAYTSSGSGPVKSLVQGEVAIGFGITNQAVVELNKGAPLKIIYFDEGSPYSLYGQSIIKGKETREPVKKVFDYLVNEYSYINNEKFSPEKMFKDKDYTIENFPVNIVYSDMGNNGSAEKTRLLNKWEY